MAKKKEDPKIIKSQRDIRQRGIVPTNKLKETKATVIGVGAIGRQVAIQLAAMGVGHIQLIDFDTVGPENLAPQGFLEEEVGMKKVEAVQKTCQRQNSEIEITTVDDRFTKDTEVGDVVFMCVDSIETRSFIWETLSDEVDLIVDGRMTAEQLQILAANDDDTKDYYPTTIFAVEDAFQGACTAKSIIYCANIAAGLMLAQLTRHLRGLPVDKHLCMNLVNSEVYNLAEERKAEAPDAD